MRNGNGRKLSAERVDPPGITAEARSNSWATSNVRRIQRSGALELCVETLAHGVTLVLRALVVSNVRGRSNLTRTIRSWARPTSNN